MLNGYKTYLAASILAALGVLAQVDWVKFLDHPDSAAWVAIGSAVLMAVMRAITQATTVTQALNTEPPKKGK
jgi:hypothetical protein